MTEGPYSLYDWRQLLEPIGEISSEFTVDPANFRSMVEVGYLPKENSQFLGSMIYNDKHDPDFLSYCAGIGESFNNDAFHVSSPTHYAVNKAVQKFDGVPIVEFDEYSEILPDLLDMFEPLRSKVPILETKDVQMNPKASPGYVFKEIGHKNKDDALDDLWYCDEFWNTAHIEDYPVLWNVSGKVESLKKSKLDQNDIRVFIVSPFEYFVASARMEQLFNKEVCEDAFMSQSLMKHGISLSHGGFNALINDLTRKFNGPTCVGAGDCSKWDALLAPFIFDACVEVREFCWDKKGMSRAEYRRRMKYLYKQKVYSYLKMPSGQILQKGMGNCSGDVSTTDNNDIGHCFIWCYMARKFYGQSLIIVLQTHLSIALYADDHIFVANKGDRILSYDARLSCYQKFGAFLNKEKDLVLPSFEGHTFLGLTAKWSDEYGCFVPLFDALKAKNSLAKYESNYTPVQRFERAVVLMLLVTFHDRDFDNFQGFCYFLKKKYNYHLKDRIVPSKRACVNFWLGRESSSEILGYSSLLESVLCGRFCKTHEQETSTSPLGGKDL